MTTRNATELPKDKADRLYLMIDQKAVDFALVKDGISRDFLRNRFHSYRTSNPMLELVCVCEPRKNQDLETLEQLMFEFLHNEKGYDHFCGEWVAVTSAEDIEAIRRDGFKFFENLYYRTKNNTYYNKAVCELWPVRAR